jgi:hypothetical protein
LPEYFEFAENNKLFEEKREEVMVEKVLKMTLFAKDEASFSGFSF